MIRCAATSIRANRTRGVTLTFQRGTGKKFAGSVGIEAVERNRFWLNAKSELVRKRYDCAAIGNLNDARTVGIAAFGLKNPAQLLAGIFVATETVYQFDKTLLFMSLHIPASFVTEVIKSATAIICRAFV